MIRRRSRITRVILTRVKGRAGGAPPFKPARLYLRVLSTVAVKRARMGARRPARIFQPPPPVKPVRPLRVILQAVQRSRRGARRPAGTQVATAPVAPLPRRLRIRCEAVNRASLRTYRGGAAMIGPALGDVKPPPIRAVDTNLQAWQRSRQARRPKGNVPELLPPRQFPAFTPPAVPPVRHLRVRSQAVARAAARPRHRSTAFFTDTLGGRPVTIIPLVGFSMHMTMGTLSPSGTTILPITGFSMMLTMGGLTISAPIDSVHVKAIDVIPYTSRKVIIAHTSRTLIVEKIL